MNLKYITKYKLGIFFILSQFVGFNSAYALACDYKATTITNTCLKSARSGDSYSMRLLVNFYFKESNYVETAKWALLIPNNKKKPDTMMILGELYEEGKGVKISFDKSKAWYLAARKIYVDEKNNKNSKGYTKRIAARAIEKIDSRLPDLLSRISAAEAENKRLAKVAKKKRLAKVAKKKRLAKEAENKRLAKIAKKKRLAKIAKKKRLAKATAKEKQRLEHITLTSNKTLETRKQCKTKVEPIGFISGMWNKSKVIKLLSSTPSSSVYADAIPYLLNDENKYPKVKAAFDKRVAGDISKWNNSDDLNWLNVVEVLQHNCLFDDADKISLDVGLEFDKEALYAIGETKVIDKLNSQIIKALKATPLNIVEKRYRLLKKEKKEKEIARLAKAAKIKADKKRAKEKQRRIEAEKRRLANLPAYRAVLSCGMQGRNLNVMACFGDTDLKITKNNRSKIYKIYQLNSAGRMRGDGLHIDLPKSFTIKAQNSHRTLVLGIKILNKQDNVTYEDQVGKWGVINVGN